MEITKKEAELILDAIKTVQYIGPTSNTEKEEIYLQLVERLFREFPDLVDIEILEWFK